MADNHTPEIRSYNMSQIKCADTKPETFVRKQLFSAGFRYRKNDKRYPGKPDIVLPRYHTVIFVNGCFWHCHDGCPGFVIPKSKQDYWIPKLRRNKERDEHNQELLRQLGWNVIVVWECQLKKKNRDFTINELIQQIRKQ